MRFDYHRWPYGVVTEGPRSLRDCFEVGKITYRALPLEYDDPDRGRGPNSTVLRAVLADGSSPEEHILKISNVAEEDTFEKAPLKRARFDREVRAYREVAAAKEQQWVLDFEGDATITVGKKTHRCILLEKADYTLDRYLRDQLEIGLQQRLLLCYDILKAFKALHDIGIYHRDIKPENLFFVDRVLKIGDLGLVNFRADDKDIDLERERIGPIWWMAPEAVNRCLCLPREGAAEIEQTVGAAADIYQLGKLFWYIIQGDVPNGVIRSRDLRAAGTDVYGALLKPLLHYHTPSRPVLAEILPRMEPLRRRYGF